MPPSTNKKITQDNAKALMLTIVPKTQGTVIFNSLGGIYSNAQGREIARKGHKRRISREATLPIMSALGYKRTFALHQPMSALPPKADMCSAAADVCFGPKADMPSCPRVARRTPSFGLFHFGTRPSLFGSSRPSPFRSRRGL